MHDAEEVLPLKDKEGIYEEFNKALLPSLCKEESCNVSFWKKSALIASTTRTATGATGLSTIFKNLFVPLVEQDTRINIESCNTTLVFWNENSCEKKPLSTSFMFVVHNRVKATSSTFFHHYNFSSKGVYVGIISILP